MSLSTGAVGVLALLSAVAYLLVAFFSVAEGALARLSVAVAQDLVQDGARRASQIETLAQERKSALAYCRSARTFCQTAAICCLTLQLCATGWAWYAVASVVFALGTALLVLTTLPPAYMGRRYSGTAIRLLAGLIWRTWRLGRPFGALLRRIRPPSPLTQQEERDEVAEDLREMVDQIGETDTIEQEDREMIWSVLELGRTLVREVMVPRTEMITVETAAPLRQTLSLFVKSGYSRLPVIGEDSDDVRGVVLFKDVAARLHRHPESATQPVHTLMREIQFVPETKLVDDLLRQMQEERFHLAMVVDEYGLIAGLVTLEDLVEEVIGEVADEHDHGELLPEQTAPGVWQVPARLGLDELGDLFEMEIEDDDVDTVGGLLTKALGLVPLVGSTATWQDLQLRAIDAQGRRRQVSLIEVTRIEPKDATDE